MPRKKKTPVINLAARSIPVRVQRGRFDVAQTTTDNSRYWIAADSLSPNAAISAAIRATIRQRSRYEIANNSWARGIVETLANDVIGKGPQIQMLTADANLNSIIEEEFSQWMKASNLGANLRLIRKTRIQDGESFAVMVNNSRLKHPVKLDIRLLEADQITTPTFELLPTDGIDGIDYDDEGNPIQYKVLKNHPGSSQGTNFNMDYTVIPAISMIHYFRQDRPGQSRGLPDIMPALSLFADLRRYTQAVIAAAESVADFAAVLYTESPPNAEAADVTALESIEIEKRSLMSLPAGWKMAQMKAEQPATTFGDFQKCIINEIARCLSMPFNVALGNSSKYNYASGRLDHQTYYKNIEVERDEIERGILDRILEAWIAEAILISDYLPLSSRTMRYRSHIWFWTGREHVDPAKEANAQKIKLSNNTTTLADEWGRTGHDWEKKLRQRAKEIELCIELGIPLAAADPERGSPQPNPDEDDEDEKE